MQKIFTKEFMIENSGCYNNEKLMGCSFMHEEVITLQDIIDSEIPLEDKFWFVCSKLASAEENQQIAINVAEIVLPIFEKKYPENKYPREAIEAARHFIAGKIPISEFKNKRNAAAAAYAAAASAAYSDAAAAAYAAAAAAADSAAAAANYAAAAAADDYADDADDADDYAAAAANYAAAAAAADDADDADDYSTNATDAELLNFLKSICY